MTSLHALITFMTSMSLFLREGDLEEVPDGIIKSLTAGNTAIMIYTGMFTMTLGAFGLYTCCLMLDNITSNENLRTRWNASRYKYIEKSRKKLS